MCGALQLASYLALQGKDAALAALHALRAKQ